MTGSWRPAVLVVLAGLVGAGVFAAGRMTRPSAQSQKAPEKPDDASGPPGTVTMDRTAQAGIGLKVAQVQRRTLTRRLAASGRIVADPARTAQLRPLGPGRVTSVLVRSGDRVHRGQALVRYQDVSLVAIDTQLTAGHASLEQAQAARAVAAAALARGRALLGGVIAQAELDRRGAALAQADAQLTFARGQVGSLRQRRQLYTTQPGASGEAAIIAPSDGYVMSVEVAVGDTMDPARVVATVADLSTVWIDLPVYQADIPNVATHGDVPFTLAALPDQHFIATLDAASATLDPGTGAMQVRGRIANPDLRFRPGMRVEGDLPTTGTTDALTLPPASLQDIDGEPVVFMQTGPTQFRQQKVHIGLQTKELVEISDGLELGQTVVTNGSFWLKSQALQAELGSGG